MLRLASYPSFHLQDPKPNPQGDPVTQVNPHLTQWLQQTCPSPIDSLHEIAGDASFRRYFRLHSGTQTYMVMDASQQRDCFEPFVAIAKALHPLGLEVPQILAEDITQGFMLISDFGDQQYLSVLNENNADALYKTALQSLTLMQACRKVPNWTLPAFDHSFMLRELKEFKHWFVERYLELPLTTQEETLLQTTFDRLCSTAGQQPQVFIHRDYHSANLMVLPDKQAGILDFQDASIGPLTYDLVSLLRDCYIDWPDEKVQTWAGHYYELLFDGQHLKAISKEQFLSWFDWMGLQRHMKALFIFARKYLRDRVPRYLHYLPRTLNYVVKISARYPELRAFHHYVREFKLPVLDEGKRQCEA